MVKFLTDEQQEAVDWQESLLLTACPGSGKTRTLIAKLVAEIEGVRGTPRSICCITYTNTAVQEIEQRAREQLQAGDERYIYVSTIHSFCLHSILRPFAWLRADLGGARKVLTRDNPDFEAICEYAAAQVNLLQLNHVDYEAFESLSVDTNGRIIGVALKNDAVCRAAPYFWSRCAQLGYIDFGNIVYGAYLLLRDYPQIAWSLCARHPWFLIDEFQDTTELQVEMLKLLHATQRSKFFAVGDLCQSIYGFTGARPELVAPFGVHIGARSDLSLSLTFRSSRRIVNHAERLFPRLPPMTAAGSTRDHPVDPILVRGGTVFEAVTEQFLPALEAQHIALGDATILAKDWFSLITLARELRDFGTPIVGPRIKRLQEYIGDSYFAYLSELDDLVLLMDEAHRYRGSAGYKAISELKPILGLEVTATPKTVGSKSQAFKNVVYSYDLPEAMEDGYVKEPAVGTRANFDPKSVDEATLERIKLEDGINYHEHVKVALETYARSHDCAWCAPSCWS